MDNEITKVANKEKVMKNLKAGHSPMKAVQAAYPDWSEKLVKTYVAEMGLEKMASEEEVIENNNEEKVAEESDPAVKILTNLYNEYFGEDNNE